MRREHLLDTAIRLDAMLLGGFVCPLLDHIANRNQLCQLVRHVATGMLIADPTQTYNAHFKTHLTHPNWFLICWPQPRVSHRI